MKLLLLLSIFIMISVVLVPFAFADSHDKPPVYTSSNLDIYTNGLDVVITGNLKNYDPLYYDKVSYTVISPENNIVKIGQTNPNSDGTFEFSFKAGGILYKSSGDYIVKTNYGGNTHELAINYVGGESPEPCAANETRVDGVCKPTEVTPEPIKLKELGVASFVDTSKDPQSYVDRYNNEESYKEWFDENYSEYDSIYHAVGLEETISEIQKENTSLKIENRKLNNNNNVLQTQIDELNLKVINLQKIINEQIKVILQVIQDLTNK